MTADSPSLSRIVIPLGLHQIFSWGTSFYLLTVLAAPIAKDTGWSPAWITAGFSLGLLSSGLVSPRVGRAVVQMGGRNVLATGSCLLAAGLAGLALAPSLPVYLLVWIVLGAGMGASLYDAAFSTLGTLFGSSARRAITTLTLFGGFASTVCWPLSALLVETYGWRTTCGIYAAFHLAVAAPLILLALPRGGSSGNGTATPGDEPEETGAGKVAFALLMTIFVSGSAIFSNISLHLLTFLDALGFALAISVGLASLIGPSQVGARVIEILFGRRYSPVWTLMTSAVLIAAGIGLLATGHVLAALCLMLYGCGNGIWSIARGTVPLALFGAANYPANMGRLAKAAFLSQAAAPLLGSFAISAVGAGPVLYGLAGLALVNVGAVIALIRLRRPS